MSLRFDVMSTPRRRGWLIPRDTQPIKELLRVVGAEDAARK